MKLTWNILIAFFLLGCSSVSYTPTKAQLEYTAPTQQESIILAAAAQDQQNNQHNRAIKQFQSVLIKNPDSAVALYGLSSSYYVLANYKKSLKYSTLAAKYKTPFLANTYLLMGLNYEKINQFNHAISIYQFAVKQYKTNVNLHYQLAKAYLLQDKIEQAVEILKQAIILNPYHRESHLRLGMAYYENDYKTPALLSFLTFLLIEPDSKRSKVVVELIDNIFKSGIEQNKKTGIPELTVNPNAKKDEGDFDIIDLTMSARRIDIILNKQKNTDMQIKSEQLKSCLLILSQLNPNKEKLYFVENHYFPLYKSIYKNNLTTALLYFTHKSSANIKINKWLNKNKSKINELKKLFKSFRW